VGAPLFNNNVYNKLKRGLFSVFASSKRAKLPYSSSTCSVYKRLLFCIWVSFLMLSGCRSYYILPTDACGGIHLNNKEKKADVRGRLKKELIKKEKI
jgi:hypothetical protein